MCSAPHEAAPSFATLKLTHVFRLARAEQHSPTLAVTEPRLISGQPCNGRADVGRQPPTSNYELLDQAGIAASPPGHTQTRTGVVSLIDRRTSRDHFSGLMRSGHSGPLGKSAVSAPARAKGARVPLRGDSSRWSGRKLVSRPATEAPKNPLVRKSLSRETLSPMPLTQPQILRENNCQPYKLRAQYARGLPHFR